MLALQREDVVHHVVRRAMIVAGQQPVDADQAPVHQNLWGKFARARRLIEHSGRLGSKWRRGDRCR